MSLLARARVLETQGRSIIHMEIGEPDFPTPEAVVNAGIRALQQGHTFYTPATGLPELRKAVSNYYAGRYKVNVDPKRILITPGASGALQLALGVLLEHDDYAMMTDPGYPCNRNFVRLLGANVIDVPVDSQDNYQLSARSIEANWRDDCRAVLMASPSNPTGTAVSRSELEAIFAKVTEKQSALIVDEIYQGLNYDQPDYTALSVSDDLFVVNSFSKYFGMTGWRVGWLVAPESMVDDLDKLAQNIFLAVNTPAQHAALAAFESSTLDELEQRRQEFRRRRDYLLPALKSLGFKIAAKPHGAFYLYADCSDLAGDSFQFATDLLEHAGVAVTPGIDFGAHRAKQHIRFAYTTEIHQLEEGVKRLRRFIS